MDKEKLINEIFKAVTDIRYGYVQIIIQDSKVVQIDKTEKIRLNKKGVILGEENLSRLDN